MAELVEGSIADAEGKLVTMARLLGSELGNPDLSPSNAVEPVFEEAVVERLRTLVEPKDIFLELQYFSNAPIVAGESNLVVSGRATQRADLWSEEELRAQALQNAATELVQEPFSHGRPRRSEELEKLQGVVTLTLSAPTRLEVGATPIGVLVGYVDFTRLTQTLASVAGTEYEILVSDRTGAELAHLGRAGADTLGLTRTMAFGEWRVSVREARSGVLAPLLAFRTRFLLGAAFSGALAILTSLVFSMWLTRPIAALRRAAGVLEAGDLSARVRIERRDELGDLARAFDRMARAVNELDGAKSDFVANVSHELRTPLTSLRLSVGNLIDGVTGDLDPRQERALKRIEGDLERLVTLVGDLLEMARIDAGAVAPTRERLVLSELASSCVEALEPLASERAVELEVLGEGELDADRAMLQRVVINLLDNAIKFSPHEARVRILLADREIRIEDEGPGVPPDESERIFESFRRGAKGDDGRCGFGLGLAIVRRLTELQGGSVQVESASRASGAAFVLRFPEARP